MSDEPRYTVPEAHEKFARELHREVWSLLEKSGRTQAEAERMKYAVYASCYHWLHADC